MANVALSYDVTNTTDVHFYPGWYMYDKNNVRVAGIYFIKEKNSLTKIIARVRNSDGSNKDITLAVGDTI